jgi:hypothetical protein
MERVRMGWHSLECYTCKKAEPPSVDFGITSRSVTLGPPLSDWCSLRCGIKLRLTSDGFQQALVVLYLERQSLRYA